MHFKTWLENRQGGKSLPETGYEYPSVVIYRGVLATAPGFMPNDYVTRSKKFAIGHADHVAAVEDEYAVVLQAVVPATDVFEADNPGEYFYKGPQINGKVVYTTT